MPVVLPEPARQQLVELGADLLGRLPNDEIPAGLRPLARFTPSRRRRIGAAAISATLDSDDGFRGRLADAVRSATPDLVAAVDDGAPTAASDPIDVAVVAYLTRPDGWEATIAAATAQWTDEQAGTADEVAVSRLREELVSLRAAARSEPVRIRQAVQAAREEFAAELEAARQALRERSREQREHGKQLRAAELARDEAQHDRAEQGRRLGAQVAGNEAEIRRLRARVAELERSAGDARREARAGRDVDDARLWLLTETLLQAAAGVRRELSLAAPKTRPGDTVGGADATAFPVAGIRDAAGLSRALTAPQLHLIVDGYNVTKTGYGEQSLADQRARLITALAGLAARTGVEVTVAFDGARRPAVQPVAPRGVRVLFSQDEIADDLIRRLVAAEPVGRPILVVTSDQEIVADVSRAGAWTVASVVLLEVLA
jgi:hypothetical protein